MGSRRPSEDRSTGNRKTSAVTYNLDVDKGPIASSTPKGKIKSNATIQGDPSSQYVTQLPVVPSQPEKFNPTPYTFRMPIDSQTNEIKESYAKCPPFYLQLDHTLAVVWSLFCKQKINRPLGIAQLQWALSFLKGIYNKEGERPKDVAICIQAIEDELIEQYAAMVDDTEEPEVGGDDDEAVPSSYCCGGKPKKQPKEGASEPKPATSQTKADDAEVKAAASEAQGEMKPEEPKSEADPSTNVRSTKSEGGAPCKSRTTTTKNVPFSFNYSDMMKSSPVCVEQIYKAKPEKFMTDEEMKREYEQLKGKQHGLDGSCSRDDMLNFLKEWRKEQVAKIEAELKRLHSIENFMEICNKENKAAES